MQRTAIQGNRAMLEALAAASAPVAL
jgi:hypothetical protein